MEGLKFVQKNNGVELYYPGHNITRKGVFVAMGIIKELAELPESSLISSGKEY